MACRGTICIGVALGLITLVACGDEGTPQGQPASDDSMLVGGAFDELPVPPLAEPLGPERAVNDVVVRSYGVRDSTVESVMSFYEVALAGEEVITAVRAVPGAGDVLQGEWRHRGRRLRVTVQSAPAADEEPGVEDRVQVSLELHES